MPALRPRPPLRPRITRAGALSVVTAVLATVSACGGSGSPGTAPTSTTSARAGSASVAGSASGTAATAGSTPAAPSGPAVQVREAQWRLPSARSREVVVAMPGGLLVAGGLSSARVSTSTVWLIDPARGRLRSTGHLATAVHDATGFVLAGTAYVAGGGAASTVATLQRLAPGGSATVVGNLPQPRSDLSATTAGGSAYLLGGFDGARSLPQVLRTNDGRHLTTIARLPVTVRYAAVVAVGQRLYVFGGEHDGVAIDDVQEVDLATGQARIAGHLPHVLSHESAFVLGGAVWLAGGRSGNVTQRTLWRWSPAAAPGSPPRFRRAGRLPYAVADAGTAVDGTRAWLLGGETPGTVGSVIEVSLASAGR